MRHPFVTPGQSAHLTWAQLPKHGQQPEDCQDAVDVVHGRSLAVAISDGATKSSGSRLWAQLLTRLGTRTDWDNFDVVASDEWLHTARLKWLAEHQQRSLAAGKWFNVHAAHRPGAATLLIVQLSPAGAAMRWRARAIGDSCVLHYGSSRAPVVSPVTRVEDFGLHPELLSSHVNEQSAPLRWHCSEGELADGELLVLATDAVAKYLIATPQARDQLGELTTDAAVDAYLRQLQHAELVEDDDLTLVVIRQDKAIGGREALTHDPQSVPLTPPARAAVGEPRGIQQALAPRPPSTPKRTPSHRRAPMAQAEPPKSKLGLLGAMVVVSIVTHVALRAVETRWERRAGEPPPIESAADSATSSSSPSSSESGGGLEAESDEHEVLESVDERQTVSDMGGQSGPSEISTRNFWICCSLEKCEVIGNIVRVNCGVSARDEKFNKVGQMPYGDYPLIETAGSELARHIDCSKWCRISVPPEATKLIK